ncbi:hypothetical protein BH11MYX4_BH11MYX4_33970 [soil metagenome]
MKPAPRASLLAVSRGLSLSLGLLVAQAPAGCASDAVAGAQGATAEALLGGTSMADTPWPSDVFLRGGRLDVRDVMLEGGQPAASTNLAAALSELDGAPTYTSAFFPTNGEIASGPLDGVARWIDLDAPVPEVNGARFYRKDTHEVVALPPVGVVFEEGHRIGCVGESAALRPSAAMRDAMDGKGAFAGAFAALAPRLGGRTPSAATVFTIGHPTRVAEQMRDVAAALPPPRARVTRVFTGASLDDLLGHPTTTRPGLGDPAGVVHDEVGAVVLGTFDAPSFLAAQPPRLGRVELDDAGRPLVKGTEAIPFMLALPRRPATGFGRTPVAIFQHGLNAGRSQVASVANDYARGGYATIGIDALWHADRGKVVRDERHEFTGAAGGDGLADGDPFGASLSIFDLDGDAARGVAPLDARYVRDNFRQAIVDLAELVRLLQHGDLASIAAADPSFTGLALDAESLVYTSESFGSVIGAGALALATGLRGGVLSVGGGGIFLATLPSSPMFNGLVVPLLRTTFDPALDVSDPAVLPGGAQRSLSLLQAAFAPGDPLSFAPKIAAQGKSLLLLEARSDELIPNQATELLAAAARATSVALPSGSEGPRFATLPLARAPFERAPATLAIVQLTPALHTMFTAFNGNRVYQPDFPPFVPLASAEPVESPTELAHALALAFMASLRSGGPGRVEALPR